MPSTIFYGAWTLFSSPCLCVFVFYSLRRKTRNAENGTIDMQLKKSFMTVSAALCASGFFFTAWLCADPPKPLGMFSGITPTTGPAVVDGLLTDQQKRDRINALWDQQNEIGPNAPHARWEIRTGRIAATKVATTGPSATPADAGMSSTIVSVHLNNLPARQALIEFGRQTGMRLSLFPSQSWRGSLYGNITLNADRIPLLEAVNELCCQGGFAMYDQNNWGETAPPFDPAHPRMLLEMQQPNNALGPWEICGPFAFDVQQIAHSMELTRSGAAAGPVVITFGFKSEPGLVVLCQSQTPDLVEAVDEKGHRLTPWQTPQPQPQPGFWGRLLPPRAVAAPVQDLWQPANRLTSMFLNWPVDAGHSLVRLRAVSRILVQVKSELLDVDFSSSPNAQTKEIAGMRCTIGPIVSQNAQQGNCEIKIERGKQTPAEWKQLRAALVGITPKFQSRGSAVRQVQQTGSSSSDDEITTNYFWWVPSNGDDDSDGKATRLTLEIPTEMKAFQLPIEFDNLPLP